MSVCFAQNFIINQDKLYKRLIFFLSIYAARQKLFHLFLVLLSGLKLNEDERLQLLAINATHSKKLNKISIAKAKYLKQLLFTPLLYFACSLYVFKTDSSWIPTHLNVT